MDNMELITAVNMIKKKKGIDREYMMNAIETALTQLKKDDPQELLKEALKILSIF